MFIFHIQKMTKKKSTVYECLPLNECFVYLNIYIDIIGIIYIYKLLYAYISIRRHQIIHILYELSTMQIIRL